MKKTDTLKNIVVTAILMLMTMGCTDDMDRVGGLAPTDVLRFTASLGDEFQSGTSSRSTSGHLSIVEEDWTLEALPADTASSRATLITSLSNVEAGVIAYNGTDLLSSFTNRKFKFDGDEMAVDGTPIYWKEIENGLTTMEVYAYAPYSLNTTIKGKSFSYTIPAVANQQDIIVAKSEVASAGFRKVIPLTFTHALTAVRFAVGFECKVESITLKGIHNTGNYTIGQNWSGQDGSATFTTNTGNILMLLPQTLPTEATVELKYKETDDSETKTITTSIADKKWEPGKLITYTLHKGTPPTYIYFDLALGNVTINASNYTGYVNENGSTKTINGTHFSTNKYYVYQSTETNRSSTGLMTNGEYVLPTYPAVKVGNKLWSDFITNNTNVEEVIETWDDAKNVTGKDATNDIYTEQLIGTAVVRTANRTHTKNYIHVSGGLTCNLTIDNLYSVYQQYTTTGIYRSSGSLTFLTKDLYATLKVNLVGDNRFGSVHYHNSNKNSEIIFEGAGSLTVADADFNINTNRNPNYKGGEGYFSNHWFAAIGGSNNQAESYGITIKSGVIFAGTTKAENSSAIGGGGNRTGIVKIEGGVVTAVATTTGTAIGGGIGFIAQGGIGNVTISGGNVYAYNHANRWGIPSSAIGGGGSSSSTGTSGTVIITNGNVYAYSALGTAIGGGSSETNKGGDAKVTISGGTVIAKSGAGAGIGGGTGCSGGSTTTVVNGGNAIIKISGNPIIRTGSIGGGLTNGASGSKIGYAQITVDGGDTQAQFVLAAGSSGTPSFTMNSGTIRNSNTSDEDYLHIRENGGAVWLEDGICTINGGTIQNCTAEQGGAIYISGDNTPTFIMNETQNSTIISNCTSTGNGGAVYLEGGTVTLNGGTISDNLAQGGHGGGVYIKEGSFYMPTGSTAYITENSAIQRVGTGGSGGGLYVTSKEKNVIVNILSGNITNNTSDSKGGGVCVEMYENSLVSANVTVGESGDKNPDISGNHTLLSGGGLYVSGQKADITINGGKINGNTTSAYVPNENVANEGGLVTLNDGDVTHNVVTFYSNGGTGEPETRKIVTATNGLLTNAPAYSRPGYEFINWNTRADGNGDTYSNGQTINISADMELYAQWKLKN